MVSEKGKDSTAEEEAAKLHRRYLAELGRERRDYGSKESPLDLKSYEIALQEFIAKVEETVESQKV